MKYYSIFISLVLCLCLANKSTGQSVNFEDGFEDADLTNNPTWSGDTTSFDVVNSTPNYLLQLNASASPSYLSTPSNQVNGIWEFYIEFRGFEPSGSNKADIFVMSDRVDLTAAINGYAVQVGESGDDVFKIVRFDNGTEAETVLADTTVVDADGGGYTVRVQRDSTGNWRMAVGKGYGGLLYDSGNTGNDSTYTSTSHFGPLINFTSTRSDKFFFDFKIDLPPFSTTSAIVSSDHDIDVTFNRPFDPATLSSTDFSMNNRIGSPASISFPAADTVRLTYNQVLPSNKYILSIDGVTDQTGNQIQAGDHETVTVFGSFEKGDVKLNEFMYDPPSGQAEYIEIKNTSDKYLDLSQWKIGDNSNFEVLPTNPITLNPKSFLVISEDTTALYKSYGHRPYYRSGSLPSLNNGGDAVRVLTDAGTMVDSLNYTPSWGGSNVSLERRSIATSAAFNENWGNSPNATGGTPGLSNEITQDTSPPKITSFKIISDQTMGMVFDERLDSVTASRKATYMLPNSTINAVSVNIDSVKLTLNAPLQNAQNYSLTISGLEDIFGNTLNTDTSFTYYKVSAADSGDIAINEFMYAPPSKTEYLELYNHSEKSLDLQNWTLSDDRHDPTIITDEPFTLPPDSYVVIAPEKSLQEDFPDIRLLSMGNDFPTLNNGGDQIVIRNNKDELLDSLQYQSDWGGDGIALERRSTEVAGSYVENWGESPTGFGTPGLPNQVLPDDEPPKLLAFAINSDRKIMLRFSERLSAVTAEQRNNYSITGSDSIEDVTFSAPDSVLLTFSNSLRNDSSYTLSIKNVSDIFNNSLNQADTLFTFYTVSTADSGDVFINEFSYDPASGSTEYIELYNSTNKSFDLKNWTLSDNRRLRSTISHDKFIVPPDSFVVIAPDNSLKITHPGISLLPMNSFPSLNNSGDTITLRNDNGILLDSLTYTSAWGGNQVALERRTVTIAGKYNENWANASNSFGTPGTANDVPDDQTAPELEKVYPANATTLQLVFSETITPASATDMDQYTIDPYREIQLVAARDDSITLMLNRPLASGKTYSIGVSQVSDIFGNTLNTESRKITFLKNETVQGGDVVLNEILYNPGPGQADFVELYNTTGKFFNLNNWFIGDASKKTELQQDIILPPDGYIVLTGSSSFAAKHENTLAVSDFPALNNNRGDAVYIQQEDEITVDSLYYSQSWGSNKGSLERIDPLAATNDPSNWKTSSTNGNISPGKKNINYQPDAQPPKAVFSKLLPNGNIEVRFNEFINITQDLQFSANGELLNISSFDSTQANMIYLTPGQPTKENTPRTILVNNLSDVKGNTNDKSEIAIAHPLEPSALVINEIMYDPLNKSDDNQPDQSEYVELRNTRDYAVSLEGLVLHDTPDENGSLKTLHPVTSIAKWVPAHHYVLIYADKAPYFDQSKIAHFFNMKPLNLRSILRIDRSSLSLASSDDAIFIADSAGSTIDSVYYDESWQNPNLIDTKGIALERVNPNSPGNDESNWGSSVNARGGTPGKENSIYQSNPVKSAENGITFTPNPFSPDGDGYEDKLFINYKLDQQDYLIRVRIYDRYGRLVRKVADGKPAGFEGQVIWDGRQDDDSRNRIGIYIVVFEAYDSASGSDKSFKKTVVLARKLN
jgi:hypothetical protein